MAKRFINNLVVNGGLDAAGLTGTVPSGVLLSKHRAACGALENYTVLPEDGITHLTIEAATAAVTVTMPAPALCKGRLMKVYVSDATETVTVAGDTYTAGSYEIFCDGTGYLRMF